MHNKDFFVNAITKVCVSSIRVTDVVFSATVTSGLILPYIKQKSNEPYAVRFLIGKKESSGIGLIISLKNKYNDDQKAFF